MFDNLEALMKLMGLDMTRGVKATLYMTNIDDAGVVLKVWLEECNWKEYPALTFTQVQCWVWSFPTFAEAFLKVMISTLNPRCPNFPVTPSCKWTLLQWQELATQSSTPLVVDMVNSTEYSNKQSKYIWHMWRVLLCFKHLAIQRSCKFIEIATLYYPME